MLADRPAGKLAVMQAGWLACWLDGWQAVLTTG
jgi:hypothetical protein